MVKAEAKDSPVRKTLREILAEATNSLTPEELWQQSGIGEDLIDQFYFELKKLHASGLLTQHRDASGTISLQIIKGTI